MNKLDQSKITLLLKDLTANSSPHRKQTKLILALVVSESLREKLTNDIKKRLQNYEFTSIHRSSKENINQKSIVSNFIGSDTTIFFGKEFEPNEILEKLENINLEEQDEILFDIFVSLGCIL